MEEQESRKKVILDYLKKYTGKYRIEDLKKKIILAGYSKNDVDEAIDILNVKLRRPFVSKEEEIKRMKEQMKKEEMRKEEEKARKKEEFMRKKAERIERTRKELRERAVREMKRKEEEEKKKREQEKRARRIRKMGKELLVKRKEEEKMLRKKREEEIKEAEMKRKMEELKRKREIEKERKSREKWEEKRLEEEKKWKIEEMENTKGIMKPNFEEVRRCSEVITKMKKEIARVIVGQDKIVDSLIRAILCDGHVLVEGVPGIAKTLAVKALAEVSGCESKRIQFTVDLLPTDIIGITTYTPDKGFEIVKGPVFANFVIADEINRSPSKTQSALIEAMQEKQVTIGKTTFKLPLPFFVMATENPLETSGVYTLPEAQIDRFLFKILMGYPNMSEENIIMEQNVTLKKFEDFKLKAVTSPDKILKMQELTKKIYLSKKIREYILKLVELTRTKNFENGKYLEWGASPRASIALFIASKARALTQGRNFVTPKDVKDVIHEVLRHRIILSYKAGVDGITSDKITDEILEKIRVP